LRNLIKSFLDYAWPYWSDDIINFDQLSKNIILKNIKKLDVWTYDSKEELTIWIIMKDESHVNFYLDYKLLKKWLIINDLGK